MKQYPDERADQTLTFDEGVEEGIAAALSTDEFRALISRAKVMIVDDAEAALEVLQIFLEEAGYSQLVTTTRAIEAMTLLRAECPGVLLLDIQMPELSGLDILQMVRKDSQFHKLPVVVLTAATDAATKLEALTLGASDFLSKPVDSSELALRLRNPLASKAYQDRLIYIDGITDLPNRRAVIRRLDDLISTRKPDRQCCVVVVSLDKFQRIELTESAVMGDSVEAVNELTRIRSTGAQLSIDDFGIGYSYFQYLVELPVSELKIDRAFVSPLDDQGNGMPSVTAITSMAHSLGLTVVAEGVESEGAIGWAEKSGL